MTLTLLARRWNRRILLGRLCLSLAAVLPLGCLSLLLLKLSNTQAILWGLLLWVAILVIWRRYGHPLADGPNMAQHLNRMDRGFQDSAELMIADPATLNPLEKLQLSRLQNHLAQSSVQQILLPARPVRRACVLTGSVLVSVLLMYLPHPAEKRPAPDPQSVAASNNTAPAPDQYQIMVTPPRYTRLASEQQMEPALLVPEGSVVTWSVSVAQPLSVAQLVFGDGETLDLKPAQHQVAAADPVSARDQASQGKGTIAASQIYSTQFTPREHGYYALHLTGEQGLKWQSEYYKILIRKDLPPDIRILEPLAERTLLDPEKADGFSLKTALSDDYGISAAAVRLTLARGKGESVKFQQLSLPFALPETASSPLELEIAFTLQQLNIGAGDEVYIQIEATDNRPVVPNQNRSAMFVIKLTGAEDKQIAAMEGIGINPVPEFFRSQRQLIIDTEKLIADRSNISATELGRRGNNLGIDQKILRLRYGKFLGEEFTTNFGGQAAAPEADHEGHDHGNHEEHGDHEAPGHQKEPADGQERTSEVSLADMAHDHEPPKYNETSSDLMQSALMADYVHLHDTVLEASYLPEQVQTQLRACLAQMWDSERYLRLAQPETALPFQYRALELLKQVQQADRMYIQRLDTESPPIDVAKTRFSGTLDEMAALKEQAHLPQVSESLVLQRALAMLHAEPGGNVQVSSVLAEALDLLRLKAGERPDLWLAPLNRLQQLSQSAADEPDAQILAELRKDLWRLIPQPDLIPERRAPVTGTLARDYLFEVLQTVPQGSTAGGL